MATPQSRAVDPGIEISTEVTMSVPDTPPPAPDWSALASRSDEGGSICRVPSGSHARWRVARARPHRQLAAAAINAAAAGLPLPDGHAASLLGPAPLPFAPTGVAVAPGPPPSSTPPSPPTARIDRPPRA
jgi:hypothetical protein